MFSFLIVAISALCSTQVTGLSNIINDVHLHAKLGEDLPESVSLTDPLDVADQHVSLVAQRMVTRKIEKKNSLFKKMYGPIENVVLPGVKLPRPINLTKIRITGISGLHLHSLEWRMASNRVTCNATMPFFLVDVTFDKLHIELDEHFGDEEFYTDIHLSVHLLDLEILASARYNIKGLNNSDLFIDKAEVDINAKEAVFDLKVVHGLEEVRYVLSELMNNPLEDIMDAVLKVVVNEINKQLRKIDPKKVKLYSIGPKNTKKPIDSIVINPV